MDIEDSARAEPTGGLPEWDTGGGVGDRNLAGQRDEVTPRSFGSLQGE